MVKNMSYSKDIGFLADRDGESQQSIPSGVATIFQAVNNPFNVGNFYNTGTFEWTPSASTYLLHAHIKLLNLDSNDQLSVTILKDGARLYFDNVFATANNQDVSASVIGVTVANGSNVYRVEIEHDQGGALNLSNDKTECYFYGLRIGRLPV